MKNIRYITATRWYSQPPSHFNNPRALPETYTYTSSSSGDKQTIPENNGQRNGGSRQSTTSIPYELSKLVAIGGLTYFAIDNYINRMKLEKLAVETSALNLKTLRVQQTNFVNARNKRNLQIIQERKQAARRDFKMAIHIALLRKQLKDHGLEPIEIEDAIAQFESDVKVDNSISNISGQTLWLQDDSELKLFLPDTHEYDRQNDQNNEV
jgi:hypothetical protein